MAVMMSNTPIMLERELFKAHEDLNEFKEIINKYVITYSAKNDGTIIESSEAFEKVSGYSKEELIGNKISIIKHPTEDKETIKNLLNTIRKNGLIKKNGV
jgi:PAS domain S-box-containing protein